MPRLAKIDVATNVVVNVIVADSTWTEDGFFFVVSDDAGIDDHYDPASAAFDRPVIEAS